MIEVNNLARDSLLVVLDTLMGDFKIPHSRMTKTCCETLVTCMRNVCAKSQEAICTICWGYQITM